MTKRDEALLERPLVVTWVALLVLVAATVGSSYLPLGWGNGVANLVIAAAKAALVMLVFMKLATARGVIRVFAFGVFLWIVTMVALALLDAATQPR